MKSAVLLALFLVYAPVCIGQAPVKVGVSLPLSGPVARMGEAFRRGVEMYEQEHAGTNSVQILFDDHRYEGKQSISSFYHLTKQEKVDLFVGWGNMPAQTVAPLAETAAVPSLFLTHNQVAKDRAHVVAMGNRFDKAVNLLAGFFDPGRFHRPAALSVNIGNALEAVSALKQKLGGNLLDLSFEPDLTSFQPLILKMQRASVDALLLFAVADQAMTFGQQAKALRFNPAVIGGDIFADELFLKQAESLFGSITFVYGAVREDFIRRYRAKAGDVSYFFEAASGYTLAQLAHSVPSLLLKKGRPSWREVLTEADLSRTPLIGAAVVTSPDDGLRLECDSALYNSRDLLKASR